MAELLFPADFIRVHSEGNNLLLDARSSSEFMRAHIPGALNIPLLDDEERRQVGITYKSNGRDAAVLKGFDLVGKKFGDFIREVRKHTSGKQVMIYCWRGGMRSNIMSWLLATAGYRTVLLKGGYKAFRNWVFLQFEQPKKIIVIGGKTGSGKTALLELLRLRGEQVICLETLACHRGSAFGAMGMKEAPRNEMFQNMLAISWSKVVPESTLWLENESQTIGPIVLPPVVYELIRNAPILEIVMDRRQRIKRIVEEYGKFPVAELVENTGKLSKRLGGLKTKNAIEALLAGDFEKWVDEVLAYYDKTYEFGFDSRKAGSIYKLEAGEDLNNLADLALNMTETVFI